MEKSGDESNQGPLLVGVSKAIMGVRDSIRKVAPHNINLLITGETGTGKEVAARVVHRSSLRSDGPFVAVNCPATPEQLAESELFGHEKGAFTGAADQKLGKFEMAQRGTILLDEIADLPLPVQAKTLRVLQERQLERIGGTKTIPLDIRVISATSKDLDEAVRKGSFRLDLLYRLKARVLNIPPLRERPEDVPVLVEHFLDKFSGLSPSNAPRISRQAIDFLMGYSFPGNVRELESIIQSGVIEAGADQIDLQHLPSWLFDGGSAAPPGTAGRVREIDLLRALKAITLYRRRGTVELWYTTIRSVRLEGIQTFLVGTGGREFSRCRFADELRDYRRGFIRRDATAGRYLKMLVAAGILAHNGQRANRVRYRLEPKFLSNQQ